MMSVEKKAEFMKLINRFLRSLPERQRNVFIRRYFYTDSVPDIAKRYGISQANVLKILSQVRLRLKDTLDQEWNNV